MHPLKNFYLIGILLLLSFYSSLAQSNINPSDSLSLLAEDKKSKLYIANENEAIRLTLDSINLVSQQLNQALDGQPNMSKDSLVRYRLALIEGQEKVGKLRQHLLDNKKEDVDSTGMINEAATLYFKLGTQKGRVEERIRKQENLQIKKEAGYIWQAPLQLKPTDFSRSLKDLLAKPDVAVRQFEDSQWSNLFLLVLMSGGFFYWLLKGKQRASAAASLPLSFNAFPISESLLFFLVVLPLIDQNITTRYVEIIHFFVLIIVYWRFRFRLKMQHGAWWMGVIALYVLVILFNYMIMSNALLIRAGLIFLNALALFMGVMSVRLLKRRQQYSTIHKFLFSLYCLLITVAIFLNLIGQINIAKTTSITAIVGAVQLIGLITLGSIITHELKIQLERYQSNNAFFLRVNETGTLSFIQKGLFFVAIVLWLRVLLINLTILEDVSMLSTAILKSPHALGSYTFTFQNLINFAIVVAIANWLQKNLESFFTNQPTGKRFDAKKDQIGSKITLIRLGVIVLGFFFGVTALGISMTKLTVIIGALSVGIGLGMQNIFNNFVSGVILIFEKPFNIGDLIELGGQKGRVEKIGIRSSTLLTEQGFEIIIPNGDLLSGRVINYTYSDDYIKTTFTLKVAASVDVALLKTLIKEEIAKSKATVPKLPVEILYSAVSLSDRTFQLQCWVKNIYLEKQFKSDLLEALGNRLSETEMISLS